MRLIVLCSVRKTVIVMNAKLMVTSIAALDSMLVFVVVQATDYEDNW